MNIVKRKKPKAIEEPNEGPLYSRSKRRELTAEDLDSNIQLNRIEDCIREIKEVRENFEAMDGAEYDEPRDRSAAGLPWNEWQPERRALRQRLVSRRHQLLNKVLTDLLEVITSDVGLDKVDKELYSDHYIPRELFDAARSMAASKGA